MNILQRLLYMQYSLRGSFMSQTCYFFLWMQHFALIRPNILASSLSITLPSPHLTSPVSLSALSIHSCHVYFCPVWPASFLYMKMKRAFLFPLSFSACLVLVSVDAVPPSDSRLMSFISSQESESVEHLTRVTAAGPCPKKRHPTGGWRGDEGLKDNPRYIQDPPVESSHILYWHLGCRRQAGSYRDYSAKPCCVAVPPGCFIRGCYCYICVTSENISASA